MTTETCPRCNAPRIDAVDCPRCGVIYAKVEALAAPAWDGGDDDAFEHKIRLFAVPVALLVALGLVSVGFLHMLARTFLSMWVHEFGHASTAWICGFGAFPGPWLTPISEARMPLLSLVLAAALVAGAWWAWTHERLWILGGFATLLLAQLVCTFGLSIERAKALTIFGGDAGALVWGTVLMLTMYARPGSYVQKSWLRWGFLVIGAVAYIDVLQTWRAANADFAEIPFGENEGVTQSDATKLVDTYSWGIKELIHRYLWLAAACAIVLAIAYVRGLATTRKSKGRA